MKKVFFCLCILLSFVLFLYIEPTKAFAGDDPPLEWVVDDNLTIAAKNTARFGMLFDWSIRNYSWICVVRSSDGSCDNTGSPLQKLWSDVITFVVAPLLILFVLVSAVVLITTHGTNTTIMRLAPNFLIGLVFIFFSYSIIQFLYQFADIIMGFFMRASSDTCPPSCISQINLLNADWDYKRIVGMRINDPKYAESALVSTILIELSGLTYFFISTVLMIRKIILWFFLITSPIFPFFFLFSSVRPIGKIWISIFIKWLIYAPLFGIFLHSTTYLFSQLPLAFSNPDIGDPTKIVFPTSINIVLGIGTPPSLTNSLNLTDTFAQYLFGLIMLWIVVILPWLLIKYTINLNDNSVLMKALVRVNMSLKSNYFRSSYKTVPPIQDNFTILSTPFVKKPAPSTLNTDNTDSIKPV